MRAVAKVALRALLPQLIHNPVEKPQISVENLRSICRLPPFVPLFPSSVAAGEERL